MTTKATEVEQTTVQVNYDEAKISFDVDICTVVAFLTASDPAHKTWADLKNFIDVATKDAQWPNESTLDSLKLKKVKKGDNNNACGVFGFAFTGRVVVTGFLLFEKIKSLQTNYVLCFMSFLSKSLQN